MTEARPRPAPSAAAGPWKPFEGRGEWTCERHGPVPPIHFTIRGQRHQVRGVCRTCQAEEEKRERLIKAARERQELRRLSGIRGFNCYEEREPMIDRYNQEAYGSGLALLERSDGGGLFITGSVGRGKTELALYLGWLAYRKGLEVGGWLWPRLLERGKEAVRGEAPDPWTRLTAVDVLCLDDIAPSREGYAGVKLTEWGIDRMAYLLKARHRAWRDGARLVTLITSTVDLRSIGDTYGADIESRLGEMCAPVHIGGPDRRNRHG